MKHALWPLILAAIAVIVFITRRLRRYMQFFQQEDYRAGRFAGWLLEKRAFDRRGLVVAVIAGGLTYALAGLCGLCEIVIPLAAGAALLVISQREGDPRRGGKIPLVMTDRATRIFETAIAIALIASLASFVPILRTVSGRSVWYFWLAVLVLIQVAPLLLVLANWLLAPYEHSVQSSFLSQAKQKLARCNPTVIGITGSYGKTSVKSFLGELLNIAVAPTFWTQRSINTPMGITYAIRTLLKDVQRFAIFEMGAYQIGSIKRLCALTPPHAAVVTAVGTMHLERFGSRENVYTAKSELPAAVPADGILVCNGDNDGSRRMAAEFRKATTVLYGLDPSRGPLDCYADELSHEQGKTRFTIHWKGASYPTWTTLVGMPAISNMLGAFSMACVLGGDPLLLAAALPALEQVDNRLVVDSGGGITTLKDAFNSNPAGFSAALDVLAGQSGTRKILMTPGMIELGAEQFDENKTAAKKAAGICSLVIVVGETNREALLAGLREGGFSAERTKVCATRAEAFAYLGEEQKTGDVILIENDLPDRHEAEARF